MWNHSVSFLIFTIISGLSVNEAVINLVRQVSINCASENHNDEYIEYLTCNFTDISSSNDQLKVVNSNMDINDLKEKLNRTIYVDIVGNENYPERMPENLGKSINGTGGFTYKDSPLKYIGRKDLKDMSPDLFLIILESNKIEEIPYDTFYDLPNFHYLDVRKNRLKTLAPNLLEYAPIFTTLIVESNEIEELHPDLFKDCADFYALYAEFNNITEVHEDLFKNNLKMEVISMRHNKIRNVPIDFTRFEELSVADFTNNYGTCDTMYFSFKPYDEYYDGNEQKKWIKNVPDFQKKIEETCRNL